MAIERSVFYGKEFQELLGMHLVRCPRHLRLLASSKISQNDFEFPVIRIIIQAVVGILAIQRSIPEVGIAQAVLMHQLGIMIRAKTIQPAEMPAVAQYVAHIYSRPLCSDYVFNQLEGYLRDLRVSQQLAKASAQGYEALPDVLQQTIAGTKLSMKRPSKPLANFKVSTPKIMIPCGIPCIDSAMNGGLAKKNYGIICAYTGVGKTTLGINFAWGAAQQGFRVAFATLEIDEEKCNERLYSLVGRYPYTLLQVGDITNNRSREEIWAEARERVETNSMGSIDNFEFWDFSDEMCSIGTLEDWVKRDQDENPEHPLDVLYVDWLMCLGERPGFNAKNVPEKEVRHKLQRYGDELSMLAKRANLAVWATHQADAKAEGKDKVTMANSAEGKSAAWKASAFLGVGASEDNRKEGIFTVTGCKTRDGRNFSERIRGALHEQRFVEYSPTDDVVEADSTIAQDMQRAREGGLVALPGVNG